MAHPTGDRSVHPMEAAVAGANAACLIEELSELFGIHCGSVGGMRHDPIELDGLTSSFLLRRRIVRGAGLDRVLFATIAASIRLDELEAGLHALAQLQTAFLARALPRVLFCNPDTFQILSNGG